MSFFPSNVQDPSAVFGNLRVTLRNNLHAFERAADVSLDTGRDLVHQTMRLADNNYLSLIELQQDAVGSKSLPALWGAFARHWARLGNNYFTFTNQCIDCQHKASDRLLPER